LTWDETFTIRVGDLSRAPHEGYADREFMLLAKELRDLVKARNPEIAFLASDCTGLSLPRMMGHLACNPGSKRSGVRWDISGQPVLSYRLAIRALSELPERTLVMQLEAGRAL